MNQMAKLQIHRSDDLNRIPTNMTATEAHKMLRTAGYQTLRTAGGHHIMEKDGTVITVAGTGKLSPWLTQLVYRAAKAATEPPRIRLVNETPLTVAWKGRNYAVMKKDRDRYHLQSLETGNQFWAPIADCQEKLEIEMMPVLANGTSPVEELLPEPTVAAQLEDEEREEEPAMEQQTTPEPQSTPAPVQTVALPPLALGSADKEVWIRVTKRYIEALDLQAEQVTAQLIGIEQERDTLQEFLDKVTGRETKEPELRRTVLPPTGPRRPGEHRERTRRPLTDKDVDTLIGLWNNGHGVAFISQTMGRATSTISKKLSDLKEAGKLSR